MKQLRNGQIRWGGGMILLALFVLLCANAAVARMALPIWTAEHAQIHHVPYESVYVPLNINRASAAELAELRGIGRVLAQRIVEYREAHGAFTDPEQLKNIQGIGEAKLKALIPQIRIDEH